MGATKAVMPKTSPILARFDPIALPTASPPAFFNAAFIDTIISGAEVPIETTVNPMTSEDIPRLRAMPTLPLTNLSAPHIRPHRPTIKAIIGIKSTGMRSPKIVCIVFIRLPENGIVRGWKSMQCISRNFLY
jgi:hypothetical protein